MSNYVPQVASHNKRRKKETSPSSSSSGFLHSLPEAVTISCLARLSRLDHAALSLVSKSCRSLVFSSELYKTRSLMGYAEKFIYVCLANHPDPTPSWFILRPTLDDAAGKTVNRAHPIPSFPCQPREGFAVVALDWGIYVIGGWVNGKRTSGVLVLDCRSHKWHHVTSMRVARVCAEARVVNGKIYVLGGCKKKKKSYWGEVFDPKTQTWADLPISKPVVGKDPKTHPIKSLIHGNVVTDEKVYIMDSWSRSCCYYLPSQSKWKVMNQESNRRCWYVRNKWGRGSRRDHIKPTYSKDWCVIDKLIYTCGNNGSIYWCEAKDLDQCETVGIEWKKVLVLPNLEVSLFHSRAVHFGWNIVKMWESYKIMYNISNNLVELLLPETYLTNFGQNIMVLWEKLVNYPDVKRLEIWCAEISLERQSDGEIWGEVNGPHFIVAVDPVTVDPILYTSKVFYSVDVDV